ncbi:MAG: hypothetical protein Q9207_000748 [Kuettlingeria erythrocarpa]
MSRSQSSTSTSSATLGRNRQYTHLQSQLAQLNAHLADTENLLAMTAVQAEYIRGLGGWWGGLYVRFFLLLNSLLCFVTFGYLCDCDRGGVKQGVMKRGGGGEKWVAWLTSDLNRFMSASKVLGEEGTVLSAGSGAGGEEKEGKKGGE